eukprot:COSAG02_NODE_4233_length_5606_cov_115.218230_3_plen_164_part_00
MGLNQIKSHAMPVPLTERSTLTDEEVEAFMSRGFVTIKGGLDTALAAKWVDVSWSRLGMDRHDPTSWDRPSSGLFLRLEPSLSAPMREAAPRVYGAICDLVGGEERLDICTLTDTMIMNLGGNTEQEWQSPVDMARNGQGGCELATVAFFSSVGSDALSDWFS